MPSHLRSRSRSAPGLSGMLLGLMLFVLWVAGGGSRADLLGQVIVRAVAVAMLMTMVLFASRPSLAGARPVVWLLAAMLALPVLQLVPLPPEIWRALPGRAMFAEAAAASGQAQPWRPLAIIPDAAVNAAFSLVVPAAMTAIALGLGDAGRRRLPDAVLGLIVASMLVGLLQASGAEINNPLLNGTRGEISGPFANRNHFALLLAIGCALAPVWAFQHSQRLTWRAPVALGLVLLFSLTILATGSRAGLLLGALGGGCGLLIVRQPLRRALAHYPSWVFSALVIGAIGLVVLFVSISVLADRAASINRALTVEPGQDMRGRALPTVMAMTQAYFPAGTGFGGFDPLFRIWEPLGLLKLTVFNHAHNDWLEVVLDGGLPAGLLLVVAVGWWGWASVRAWRAGSSDGAALPRLGSAVLLLILVASVVDYPARTPTIMAITAVAALWLAGLAPGRGGFALPRRTPPL